MNMALFSLFAEKLAACSLSLPFHLRGSPLFPRCRLWWFIWSSLLQRKPGPSSPIVVSRGADKCPGLLRTELLLSGETKTAVSCSPSTAGTQPRPPHSLDFLLFGPETDLSQDYLEFLENGFVDTQP